NGTDANAFLQSYRNVGTVFENPIKELSVLNSSGEIISVNLDGLPSSGAMGQLLSWFVPCLAFWIVGFYVFYKKPNNTASVVLGFCAAIFGLVFGANQAGERDIFASIHLAVIAATIGPWLLLHFFLVLPEERAWLRAKPQLYLIYLPALITIVLHPFIGYANGQTVPDFRLFRLGGYAVGFLAVIGVLVFNYISARTARTRQQMKIVMFGSLAAIIPMVFLSILPAVTEDAFFTPSSFSLLFLSFIPISLGVAVVTNHLMDIDVFIRRGIVY